MVTTGLEVCLADAPTVLDGKRFGLLLNQASVDCRFRYAHHCLASKFPGQLVALFGPQHGVFCEQQDNMIETPHGTDDDLGVPVYSLYADQRKPTPAMLEGLDAFVVDLQDVGTRVYTYIWTVTYCLEACADAGIPVVILDRPNPLGGVVIEGPLLNPNYSTFVGRAAVPMRHGLTMGEMATFLNAAMGIGAEIEVVSMLGWNRRMLWPDTGRPWLPPSPNLPRFEGALVYPGQVLTEGTRLSEGRGTTTPFEVVGAPFVDSNQLALRLSEMGTSGITCRSLRFEPTFQKHAGISCAGFHLHSLDPYATRSYRFTVALLAAVAELWPDNFEWLPPPYEYEEKLMPIDILSGSDQLRTAIDSGSVDVDALCRVDVAAWQEATREFWLYDGPDMVD